MLKLAKMKATFSLLKKSLFTITAMSLDSPYKLKKPAVKAEIQPDEKFQCLNLYFDAYGWKSIYFI